MYKGHVWKPLTIFLCLIFLFTFFSHDVYATNNFINTPATLNSDLGKIPDGQEDLFYNNNILFYEWCPNGDEDSITCGSVTGDQITWIGDSYSEGISNQIKDKYSGVDIYARYSKRFHTDGTNTTGGPSGLTILKNEVGSKLRNYLVFALGTNTDGSASQLSKDINTLASTAKELNSSTKIILVSPLTNNSSARSTYDSYHEVMKSAADNHDNILLADWYEAAKDKLNEYFDESGSTYSDKNTHPNSKGFEVWLETIDSALPGDCGINIVSGGKTPEEKTWIGLRRLDYTPMQISGIMGNIAHEGGFNPISWQQGHESNWKPLRTLASNSSNSTGMGIVGFTWYQHLANLASIMEAKAPDLVSILENPHKYYKPNGSYLSATGTMNELKKEFGDSRGEEIFDILLSIQIIYLDYSIKDTSQLEGIDWSAKNFHQHYIGYTKENFSSPSEAAVNWEWTYENHAGGTQVSRQTDAEKFYREFKDLEISSLSGGIRSSSSDSSGSSSGSSAPSTGDNKDYNGDQILSDDEIALLEENKSFYQKSAEKYNLDWHILAVLHRREHGMARDNPSNGQGPFQFYSPDERAACTLLNGASFGSGALSDTEFQKHSDCAAHFVVKNYGGAVDLNTDDGVKEMFFRYNGVAGVYKQQALSLGFDQHGADIGEGSPYVMNKADEKRDPNKNPTGWGQIKTDGGSIEYPANQDHGAFVVYQAIGGGDGSSSSTNECSDGDDNANCEGGGLKIAKVAVEMAWSISEGRTHKTTPTDKQRTAQDKIHGSSADYTDCGKFVAASVLESGVDPDFPKYHSGTILKYLQNSDKWEEIQGWDGDESKLQDGDVLVKHNGDSGHVMLFTGKTSESKGGTWTDASWHDHVGIVRNYNGGYTAGFHAFRIKGGGGNCNLSDGLTEEQAQKLADYYNSDAISASEYSLPFGKTNCVSFSAFFVQHFTNLGLTHNAIWTINGGASSTVGYLHNQYNFSTGSEPKIYSVFSVKWGSTMCGSQLCGHTGVIVGKGENNDSFITIEAAYPRTPAQVKVRSLSKLTDSYGDPFAYTTDNFDFNKLNEIVK